MKILLCVCTCIVLMSYFELDHVKKYFTRYAIYIYIFYGNVLKVDRVVVGCIVLLWTLVYWSFFNIDSKGI